MKHHLLQCQLHDISKGYAGRTNCAKCTGQGQIRTHMPISLTRTNKHRIRTLVQIAALALTCSRLAAASLASRWCRDAAFTPRERAEEKNRVRALRASPHWDFNFYDLHVKQFTLSSHLGRIIPHVRLRGRHFEREICRVSYHSRKSCYSSQVHLDLSFIE